MKTQQIPPGAFYDADIRIEKLIWLQGQEAAPGDDIKEFLEDHLDRFEELFGWAAEDHYDGDPEEVLTRLSRDGKTGFLVQAATPVPRYSGGSCIFSWGYYRLKWFYTESLDSDFFQILQKWRDEIHTRAAGTDTSADD